MKVRETRIWAAGLCGEKTQERILVIDDGKPVPDGAKKVDDATQECDWRDVPADAGEVK